MVQLWYAYGTVMECIHLIIPIFLMVFVEINKYERVRMFSRPYDQICDIIQPKLKHGSIVSICGWITDIQRNIDGDHYQVRDPSDCSIELFLSRPEQGPPGSGRLIDIELNTTFDVGSTVAAVGRVEPKTDPQTESIGPVRHRRVTVCRIFNLGGNIGEMPSTHDMAFSSCSDIEIPLSLKRSLANHRFQALFDDLPVLRDWYWCYGDRSGDQYLAIQALFIGFQDLVDLAIELVAGGQIHLIDYDATRDPGDTATEYHRLMLTRYLPIDKGPADARFSLGLAGRVDAFECRHLEIGLIANGHMTETESLICQSRVAQYGRGNYSDCTVPRGILQINLDNLKRYKEYIDGL